MPLRRSISAFLLATSVGQSKVTSLTGTFQPYPAASSSSSRTLAPYTNSFFGTQPIFTQVPPRCRASTTATRAPRWADMRASRTPPDPAPITIRSKSWLSDTVSPVYLKIAVAAARSYDHRPQELPGTTRDLQNHQAGSCPGCGIPRIHKTAGSGCSRYRVPARYPGDFPHTGARPPAATSDHTPCAGILGCPPSTATDAPASAAKGRESCGDTQDTGA